MYYSLIVLKYYYVKNIQGDIIAILDTNGTAVATYSYDPYGNVLTATGDLAEVNPLRYRGYYYDHETGLYYLQSRYYDPEVGRFLNADAFASTGQGLLGNNMFAYCLNSPVVFRDSSGHAVETVFDIASIIFSLIELIGNPSLANAGCLIWDIVSAFVPFIPGSYVADIGKIGIKVANKIDDFADGAQFLTGSYKKLKKIFKGIENIEIHHIIEKRFASLFDCKARNFLSIPLTEELHQIITNRWRNLPKVDEMFKNFAYGADYSAIDYSMMERAINEVYQDMPQILKEALAWLEENWRR